LSWLGALLIDLSWNVVRHAQTVEEEHKPRATTPSHMLLKYGLLTNITEATQNGDYCMICGAQMFACCAIIATNWEILPRRIYYEMAALNHPLSAKGNRREKTGRQE
jgi:hypothetical protein